MRVLKLTLACRQAKTRLYQPRKRAIRRSFFLPFLLSLCINFVVGYRSVTLVVSRAYEGRLLAIPSLCSLRTSPPVRQLVCPSHKRSVDRVRQRGALLSRLAGTYNQRKKSLSEYPPAPHNISARRYN